MTRSFRYVQLHTDGSTATGHCLTTLELLADGRVRLNETSEWESRPGSGRSVAEELGAARTAGTTVIRTA